MRALARRAQARGAAGGGAGRSGASAGGVGGGGEARCQGPGGRETPGGVVWGKHQRARRWLEVKRAACWALEEQSAPIRNSPASQ